VVRTRLREQKNQTKYKGPIHGMIVIGREEGRKGLYGGMGAHLIKVVPNAAILFYVVELTEKYYQKSSKE
jgi:solute carrier family 25 protein 33/36